MDLANVNALRFHQRVSNKKGRIPPLAGTVGPDAEVLARQFALGSNIGSVEVSPEAFDLIFHHGANVINLPTPQDTWDEKVTSRFLAKVALEAMATRLAFSEEGLHYLATEPQFDPIREYARRGSRHPWPYYSRRIYDSNKSWTLADGSTVQRVWEFEVLHTERGEYYFALALFGLELTINYGTPSIVGYLEWLGKHADASPLYYDKNVNNPNNGI
ncbi:hypothetical protein [Umezawaea sp.]|uniref:hypothetical protein n=1 Tax=Umezawaea sp. TaxID=1955258 RepID=UPI002ED59DF8